MWATVLVVYFIKFVYTVCIERQLFLTGDNLRSCHVLLCERSAFMSTRFLMRVNDEKALATLQAVGMYCIISTCYLQ